MIDRKIQWHVPPTLTGQEAVLIFSACDMGYLEYAVSLILSIDMFSPGHVFVLHLINPTQAGFDQLQEIVTELNNTKVFISYETTDLSNLTLDQQRAYFASARFLQIKRLLTDYSVPVFSVDADSLIVNPFDMDFSDKADAQVILVRRDRDMTPGSPEHLAVATGSIWLAPLENVITFLERVSDDIDLAFEDGTLAWFVDQKVFYRQMKQMQKHVHFYNIKRKYADWQFRDTSIVWAGKGGLKLYDLRFFILQNLFSHDDAKRLMTQKLVATHFSSQNYLFTDWMQSRIAAAVGKSVMMKSAPQPRSGRVAFYVPRLDLPWKRITGSSNTTPVVSEDVIDLRLHWKRFVLLMANALERHGVPVDVHELPNWEIDRARIDQDHSSLAFVPHRCSSNFGPGATPVLFYMQEFFRWAFVVDEKGWSAASSQYPVQIDFEARQAGVAFDQYRARMANGQLASKFAQQQQRSRAQLLEDNVLPSTKNWLGQKVLRPYIFFPIQIPTDQSIQLFSDFSVMDVITALIDWARTAQVAVVLKPHPANRKSMIPFESLADGQTVFMSDANIKDLIEHSSAVYTINSGVGFEALLQLKPVVTFGRVEYDCVTYNATPNTLDDAWAYAESSTAAELEFKYRGFMNWFLEDYSIDMSTPAAAKARLDSIAARVAEQLSVNNSHKAE